MAGRASYLDGSHAGFLAPAERWGTRVRLAHEPGEHCRVLLLLSVVAVLPMVGSPQASARRSRST